MAEATHEKRSVPRAQAAHELGRLLGFEHDPDHPVMKPTPELDEYLTLAIALDEEQQDALDAAFAS